MKEAFSVKLQTEENRCFCFRLKLSKTQAAQIMNTMQSSSTFIKIEGLFPEVEKNLELSVIGKIFLYIGKNSSKAKY